MSNPALTADAVQGMMIANYVSFSTSALYAFDYLITIGQEVNFVWKQKWKLSTLLFVVNRYVALVVAAIYAVPLVNYESCIVGIDILKVTALTQFLIIAVFSAQRIYVVAPRDRSHRWLVGLVFLLSMVPFAVNIWVFARDVLVYAPVTTCVSGVPGSHELQIRLSFATRACATLGDVLVILYTLKAGLDSLRKNHHKVVKMKLLKILVRDGTLFFVAMTIINVFYVLEITLPYLQDLPPAVAMIQSMPAILTSRTILNLRGEAYKLTTTGLDWDEPDHEDISAICFQEDRMMNSAGMSELDLDGELARDVSSRRMLNRHEEEREREKRDVEQGVLEMRRSSYC